MTYCPYCGHKLNKPIRRKGRAVTFQSSHRSIFRNEAGAIAAPVSGYHELQAPAGSPTMEANVAIPLLQSAISGLFIGVGSTIITTALYQYGGLYFWPSLGYGLMWGVGLTFVSSAFLWWQRLGYYDALLWRIETITGLDLDDDEEIGPPEHTVSVKVEQGKRWQFESLPGGAQAVFKFAQSVTGEAITFSEAGARQSGYGAANFAKLRDLFIKRGWADWKDPANRQQGVILYRNGQSVLKAIASDPPPGVMADRGDDGNMGMSPNYIDKGTGKGSWS